MVGEVSAMCKKCNKTSAASAFILDPVYKMMVCPECSKARKNAEQKDRQKKTQPQSSQATSSTSTHADDHDHLTVESKEHKAAGWDEQDAYLEKVYKERSEKKAEVDYEQIDAERIRYTCGKCKYKFVYHTVRKHPSVCPYCNNPIFIFEPRR